MKLFKILDSSAFIGGYSFSDANNYTTSKVVAELKDEMSQAILVNAQKNNLIIIKNPEKTFINKVNTSIKNSGDILRLSDTDTELLALALNLKNSIGPVILLTDDYTIQNVAKTLNIKFKSILTKGIDEIYNWVLICKGCKKQFPVDYKFKDCDICGSDLYKKRLK